MLTIIILMAGAGMRFSRQGYTLPKPFIDVSGKMMIERVLDGLKFQDARYILIIRNEFKLKYGRQLGSIQKKYGVEFIEVKQLTQGAACTALAAHEIIQSCNNIVFVDSDNIFSNNAFKSFIYDAVNRQLDGSLLTFDSNEKCFSYVELDKFRRAVRTKEKCNISNHAIAGAYFFKKGYYFINAAIEMIIYGIKDNNEYYMSQVYNFCIDKGLNIGLFNINKNDFHCLGTPERLENYLHNTETSTTIKTEVIND